MMNTLDTLAKAAEALRNAPQIMVFTGAGVSAGSGIPTFRDQLTGLWERQDPQRLETAKAFRENPALVWGWYLRRRRQVMQAQPNAAHEAIHRLSDSGRCVTVVTQNVDDLHERAGNQDVLHLHGSLVHPKCFACHRYAEGPLAFPSIPAEGALIGHPAAVDATAACVQLWCGLVRISRQEYGKPPTEPHDSVTSCFLSGPQAWSGLLLTYQISPWRLVQWSTRQSHRCINEQPE